MSQSYSKVDAVRFLIVGTPRSGTTLIQRLVSELEGVAVPPETHFMRVLRDAGHLLNFPLRGEAALCEAARIINDQNSGRTAHLAEERLVFASGGGLRDWRALFVATVVAMAPEAEVYGEKTPDHLQWWEVFSAAFPNLRFVAVIRDPRDVVLSNLGMPWNNLTAAQLATKWVVDQGTILRMEERLPERAMVLRYEDVVDNPAHWRSMLATFIGAENGTRSSSVPEARAAFETWKTESFADIHSGRRERWRRDLHPNTLYDVEAISKGMMFKLGYDLAGTSRPVIRTFLMGMYGAATAMRTTRHRHKSLESASKRWGHSL